ncbi:hypothetical protein [Winogradskya humida]|uniref:N-acetyltransferase domain-containing protein n=1 Tax=Winogradskya humida TaxID=113566 RepID=A0ABQ4A7S3_9ACTN|nr:hypothetical protein [Actinoplanes humidus]GIE26848.1 hypothetical protein Ahu01nite_099500 [Actinoplanes humidus]
MTITALRSNPTVPDIDEAWALYTDLFAEVNTAAAQRHLMTPDEFATVFHDPRILKFYARDQAGKLAGMAVLTQYLEAWPLISPPFFARRWPEHFRRRAIWYVGFVGMMPRHLHGFRELVRDMYAHISSNNGIAVADFCTHNVTRRRLPAITLKLLAGINPDTTMQTADTQSFVAYDFDPANGDAR